MDTQNVYRSEGYVLQSHTNNKSQQTRHHHRGCLSSSSLLLYKQENDQQSKCEHWTIDARLRATQEKEITVVEHTFFSHVLMSPWILFTAVAVVAAVSLTAFNAIRQIRWKERVATTFRLLFKLRAKKRKRENSMSTIEGGSKNSGQFMSLCDSSSSSFKSFFLLPFIYYHCFLSQPKTLLLLLLLLLHLVIVCCLWIKVKYHMHSTMSFSRSLQLLDNIYKYSYFGD